MAVENLGSTDKLGVSRSSLNYSFIVCILRIYDRIWTEFNESVEGQKIKGNHWTQMRSWIFRTILNCKDHFSKPKDVSAIQRWSWKMIVIICTQTWKSKMIVLANSGPNLKIVFRKHSFSILCGRVLFLGSLSRFSREDPESLFFKNGYQNW